MKINDKDVDLSKITGGELFIAFINVVMEAKMNAQRLRIAKIAVAKDPTMSVDLNVQHQLREQEHKVDLMRQDLRIFAEEVNRRMPALPTIH